MNSLINRWQDLRDDILKTENIFHYIDSLAMELNEAQKRNFKKWDILDDYIWPNNYIGYNYPNEIQYLKYWIYLRLNWMDSHINEIPSESVIPCNNPNKVLVKIVGVLGKEISPTSNSVVFYIFDNGCVEKKYLLE